MLNLPCPNRYRDGGTGCAALTSRWIV